MIALAILTALQGAVSAFGAYKTAQAENQAAQYNKQAMKNQSAATLQQGRMDAEMIRDKNRRLAASQRAAIAASGIDPESGSALDISADSATQGEYEALASLYRSNVEATNYASQAKLFGMQARNARMTGYINITSSLLGGASNAYSYTSNPSFQTRGPGQGGQTRPIR